jgi:5-methylcytosine-specific restriction endonuclease McrA
MAKTLNLTGLRSAATSARTTARTISAVDMRNTSKEFYRSARWVTIRKLVKGVFNGQCCVCGSTEQVIVDHINPVEQGGNPWTHHLQLLCIYHHNEVTLLDKRAREQRVRPTHQRDFRTPAQVRLMELLSQSPQWHKAMALSPTINSKKQKEIVTFC